MKQRTRLETSNKLDSVCGGAQSQDVLKHFLLGCFHQLGRRSQTRVTHCSWPRCDWLYLSVTAAMSCPSWETAVVSPVQRCCTAWVQGPPTI